MIDKCSFVALMLEVEVMRQGEVKPHNVFATVGCDDMVIYEEATVNLQITRSCEGCGEKRARKDYKYKKYYCNKCIENGHISTVCPHLLLSDSYGRPIHKITQKEGQLKVTFKGYRTMAEKLDTASKILEGKANKYASNQQTREDKREERDKREGKQKRSQAPKQVFATKEVEQIIQNCLTTALKSIQSPERGQSEEEDFQ